MWGEKDSEPYENAFSDYLRVMNLSKVLLIGDTEHAQRVRRLYDMDPLLYRDFSIVPTNVNLNFALQFAGKH